MRALLFYAAVFLSLLMTSCDDVDKKVVEQKHAIVKTFKLAPIGVHDEISPKYRAVLSNGDTVPITSLEKPGDTITYQYYYVEK